MARLRTIVLSVAIAAFLALIAIDGLPSLGLFHDRARKVVEPWLRATGLFQGSWTIFTPRVDRENYHLEIQVDYDNGDTLIWRTPNWRELSTLDKLTHFREMEYSERLLGDSNRPVRAEFARFVADCLKPTASARPTRIAMTYHYSGTDFPAEGDHQPLPTPDEHPNVVNLYVEETP